MKLSKEDFDIDRFAKQVTDQLTKLMSRRQYTNHGKEKAASEKATNNGTFKVEDLITGELPQSKCAKPSSSNKCTIAINDCFVVIIPK